MNYKLFHIFLALPLMMASPSLANDYSGQYVQSDNTSKPAVTVSTDNTIHYNDDMQAAVKTSHAPRNAYMGLSSGGSAGGGNSSTFIDVTARFRPAASVEFKHEAFFIPDFDNVLLTAKKYFKNTEVKVQGIPGETAVVSCEIQYMEIEDIKSYTPVQTEDCDSNVVKRQVLASIGQTYQNQVELNETNFETAKYDSYIALEITYL